MPTRLESRITALEGKIKPPVAQQTAAESVAAFNFHCPGHTTPELLPGEPFTDWLTRVGSAALADVLEAHDRIKLERR